MAMILEKELHLVCAQEPGTGAAGGLGFGLRSFAGARLDPGFELFARKTNFVEKLNWAHLVISGEGAIDQSTLMGKGVGELAKICHRAGVPCVGLGGVVPNRREVSEIFTQAYAVTPDLASAEESRAQPAFWLERLAALAAREWTGLR
jgi:glycerate kinase